MEIYSAWGEFEWLLREVIERGYAVGFVAGSDDHKGRPGSSYPGAGTFGVHGGLTCVWAEALTREAIWEALWARRCYATTGERIYLRVEADGRPMGSHVTVTRPPSFEIEAVGTGEIERLELYRDLERIAIFPESMPRDEASVRITWSGAQSRGRGRMACWDGSLEVEFGRVAGATGHAFDTPVERILSCEPSSVSWQSATAGDADGIVVQLEGDARTVLRFRTDLLSADVALADIKRQPVEFDLGGVDLLVTFEMLPLGTGGRHVALSHREDRLPSERTAYWVRVTQRDGAKAWSSPIQIEPRLAPA